MDQTVPNPRWALEQSVLKSGLKAPSRHVWLTLAVVADWPAGTTSSKHTPSLSKLASDTGLSRAAVAAHLNALESAGWIKRLRPTVQQAWGAKERTRYRLTGPGDGPVQEMDQSRTQTSPGDGHRLVQDEDGASPGDGHDPDLHQTSQTTTHTRASASSEAQSVVAAFIEGATGAGQDRPTGAIVGKVGRDAKRLIGEGVPLDKLVAAANAMGRAGWNSLDTQLQRMSAHRASARGGRQNGHQAYRNPESSSYYQGSL